MQQPASLATKPLGRPPMEEISRGSSKRYQRIDPILKKKTFSELEIAVAIIYDEQNAYGVFF